MALIRLFLINLFRQVDTAQVKKRRPSTMKIKKNKNPLIFIVEDNPVYSKLIVSFLKTQQYTNTATFASGEEVLDAMDRKPVVVIQDYLLEGMNGIEVLKKAKTIHPEVEFLFLSGQDSIDVAINSIKYGAYDYIVKDQMALPKMADKISRIISVNRLHTSHKRYKQGVILFFVGLAMIIILLIIIALLSSQFGL